MVILLSGSHPTSRTVLKLEHFPRGWGATVALTSTYSLSNVEIQNKWSCFPTHSILRRVVLYLQTEKAHVWKESIISHIFIKHRK